MARRRGGVGSGSAFGHGAERVPVPKLGRSNSNLGRARGRKPPGKVAKTFGVLAVLTVLGFAIAGFVDLTARLPYRAGWAGTPGTVSEISCETLGSGHSRHTRCDGVFRSDGQALLVTVEGDNSYAGNRDYPARLHADGRMVSVTAGKLVAYIVGGMLAVLAFVVLIGWFLVFVLTGAVVRRVRGEMWRPARRLVLAPLIAVGVLLVSGIVSGIVGAALPL